MPFNKFNVFLQYCDLAQQSGEIKIQEKVPLCHNTSEIAHSEYDFIENAGGTLLSTADVQRCQCPKGSKLDLYPSQWYKDDYSNISVVTANYSCVMVSVYLLINLFSARRLMWPPYYPK